MRSAINEILANFDTDYLVEQMEQFQSFCEKELYYVDPVFSEPEELLLWKYRYVGSERLYERMTEDDCIIIIFDDEFAIRAISIQFLNCNKSEVSQFIEKCYRIGGLAIDFIISLRMDQSYMVPHPKYGCTNH